jgi:hypothetical protein
MRWINLLLFKLRVFRNKQRQRGIDTPLLEILVEELLDFDIQMIKLQDQRMGNNQP